MTDLPGLKTTNRKQHYDQCKHFNNFYFRLLLNAILLGVFCFARDISVWNLSTKKNTTLINITKYTIQFQVKTWKNQILKFDPNNYLEPYECVTNWYHYHGQQIARQKIGEQEVKCSVWMVRPLLQAHFNVWPFGKYRNELKIHRPR